MNDITLYPDFIDEWDADRYLDILKKDILWEKPSEKSKRLMSYISTDGKPYEYAGVTLQGGTWNKCEILHDIRKLIEKKIDTFVNSVLLNYYPNGKAEIRWHSDKEEQLGEAPIIPCVNLGATRKFHFMDKVTKEKTFYEVKNGDLLVMGPNCQKNYLHAILKEKEVVEPRISLTYRFVYE